ncbi:MAG: isoprenylcysteine carboxylmethyltransferase family protein [Nitrososphaera sp.]|nr:isoprenylcysteine carboxylmethyltransferase family protein [Nitrososphaera sp.]
MANNGKSAITAIKTLIFTIVVPGSVTVLVPYLLLSSGHGLYRWQIGPLRFLGIFPIILGVFFYLRCAWDFTFTGGGTPAPIDPPKRFVAKGLFRIVRNPMYVGITLILTGESILFESPKLLAYAAILWVGFHLFVIFYEEPTLRKKFGTIYEEYCRSVPRWIPKIKNYKTIVQ